MTGALFVHRSMVAEVEFLDMKSEFSKAFLYSYFEVLKMVKKGQDAPEE